LNVWQDWALAREYDVDIEKYVEVRIQFFVRIQKLAPAARPILAEFPNITRTINPQLYSPSHDYLY
jgi:hypothetical protein